MRCFYLLPNKLYSDTYVLTIALCASEIYISLILKFPSMFLLGTAGFIVYLQKTKDGATY